MPLLVVKSGCSEPEYGSPRVDDLNWYPPSPEGASSPDEMESHFSRVLAALEVAAEENNREMFNAARDALIAIFAHTVGELRRSSQRGSNPGSK